MYQFIVLEREIVKSRNFQLLLQVEEVHILQKLF